MYLHDAKTFDTYEDALYFMNFVAPESYEMITIVYDTRILKYVIFYLDKDIKL